MNQTIEIYNKAIIIAYDNIILEEVLSECN